MPPFVFENTARPGEKSLLSILSPLPAFHIDEVISPAEKRLYRVIGFLFAFKVESRFFADYILSKKFNTHRIRPRVDLVVVHLHDDCRNGGQDGLLSRGQGPQLLIPLPKFCLRLQEFLSFSEQGNFSQMNQNETDQEEQKEGNSAYLDKTSEIGTIDVSQGSLNDDRPPDLPYGNNREITLPLTLLRIAHFDLLYFALQRRFNDREKVIIRNFFKVGNFIAVENLPHPVDHVHDRIGAKGHPLDGAVNETKSLEIPEYPDGSSFFIEYGDADGYRQRLICDDQFEDGGDVRLPVGTYPLIPIAVRQVLADSFGKYREIRPDSAAFVRDEGQVDLGIFLRSDRCLYAPATSFFFTAAMNRGRWA